MGHHMGIVQGHTANLTIHHNKYLMALQPLCLLSPHLKSSGSSHHNIKATSNLINMRIMANQLGMPNILTQPQRPTRQVRSIALVLLAIRALLKARHIIQLSIHHVRKISRHRVTKGKLLLELPPVRWHLLQTLTRRTGIMTVTGEHLNIQNMGPINRIG